MDTELREKLLKAKKAYTDGIQKQENQAIAFLTVSNPSILDALPYILGQAKAVNAHAELWTLKTEALEKREFDALHGI